jgi:predicted negative regulator of RcsB-dependent stress response
MASRVSALFDALDGADFVGLIVLMLLTVAGVLAWMVRQAHEMEQQRKQAEEMAMWAELQIEEINALRERLAEVERRHENLQALYTHQVRWHLINSTVLITQNRERQRRRK